MVVAARRQGLCEQTAKEICRKGGEAFVVQTDVSHENQADMLFDRAVQQYGRIDIAVNNAGVFGGRRIAETTTKAFDEVMSVNLRGRFSAAERSSSMKAQGGGVIINISSVAGVQAWSGTGVYSASKHGVMALTKALADEGRPFKHQGICHLSGRSGG